MPLVKLNATSSTNDFLKELAANQDLENLMVVTAETQTKGRGQMGATWHSESGKNLMMSALVKDAARDPAQLFDINVAVSLSVFDALSQLKVPELRIKWPNDIMSANKKIGGILIENTIRSNGNIDSIAGIGINVNQTDFASLPGATSLINLLGRQVDRDQLLESIIQNLQNNIQLLSNDVALLWMRYNGVLFRKGTPTAFEDSSGKRFMAMILDVGQDGLLNLKMAGDVSRKFNIKEIKLLY